MNLETFRKNVEANEVYKEKMPLVRITMENQYILYEKKEEIFYREEEAEYRFKRMNDIIEFTDSNCYKLFCHMWYKIDIIDAIKMYSQMGWKIENDNEEYLCSFIEIYKKIQKIENDIDFVYAILFFTNFILKSQEIYERFVKDIFKYLKEHELSELIKWTRIDNRKTVFVAMSFSDVMKEARKKIIEAVESFGYEAMLIDIKEHNNQIVPEIFTEIKKSKFVVADLTGQRGGVYFEAGYAKALEKDLILCCKKEEQKQVHFDVAQINTIFWEDENDLYKRLRNRIESTIETETYF